MKNIQTPTACLLCSNRTFKTLFHVDEYTLCKCLQCGLVQTYPQIPQDNPDELYDQAYFERLEQHRNLEQEYQERLLFLIERYKSTGKMVEIGIGIGIFMELAAQRGWQIQGVEPSQAACDYVSTRFGLPAHHGRLQEIGFSEKQFDVVALRHVLEHVPDPRSFLTEIHRILTDDGVVALVVPNFGSLHARMEKEHWFYLSLPYHLAHYTKSTLMRLLDTAQFEILSLQTTDNSASSYIIGLLNVLRRFLKRETLNMYLKPEKLDPRKDLAHWMVSKEAIFNRLTARLGFGDELTVIVRKRR